MMTQEVHLHDRLKYLDLHSPLELYSRDRQKVVYLLTLVTLLVKFKALDVESISNVVSLKNEKINIICIIANVTCLHIEDTEESSATAYTSLNL